MPYAAVLHFDPPGEARLAALQSAAAARFTATPLPPNLRPHISIAGFELPSEPEFCQAIAAFAGSLTSFEISLEAAGAFPGEEGVVFVAPSIGPALVDVHTRFFAGPAALAEAHHAYYLPGRWVPHVTIALGLPALQVREAVELCRQSGVFGPYRIESLALLSHPPVEVLCEHPLASPIL